MSQGPREFSPDDSSPPEPAAVDPTRDDLAAQAKAAIDQALQLAKLAEESARLARHLNEQVAARSGLSVTGRGEEPMTDSSPRVSPPAISSEPEPEIVSNGDERWRTVVSAGSRRRMKRRSTHGAGRSGGDRRNGSAAARGIPGDFNSRGPMRDEHAGKNIARSWKSILLSTALHVVLLVVLGVLTFAVQSEHSVDTVLATFVTESAPTPSELPIAEPVQQTDEPQELPSPVQLPPSEALSPETSPPKTEAEQRLAEVPPTEERVAAAEETPPTKPAPVVEAAESVVDLAEVGSRSEAGKAVLLKKYGGTAASEAAVSRALDWFASVQRRDGSWNFNDVGQGSHAGTVDNPMGATSYALLAFLGAGQTHREGKYKANVAGGINFLLKNGRAVGAGADLRGPDVDEHHNFYVQGAAAMVLCEAFSMTNDRRLRGPAQGAISFILAAQDPQGGGWRYEPYEPGCTSVTTLQLMALMSAQRAGFKLSPDALDRVRHYYTTVKCDDDPTGRYCYRAAQSAYKAASTAQAALGRMYLGATRDDGDLQAAMKILDDRGPYENRYYCYYATQALKNWGGREWERWNQSMREELIRTQVTDKGPAFGSWIPLQRGPTDVSGGRLFTTALCTMTLEVYYRYLPLYDSLKLKDVPAAASTEVAAGTASDTAPIDSPAETDEP